MKKEKKIRTYQRRTKSGKMVTVKAHTAKYDAAEKAKELAKKKGAGDELEERKKKKTPQLELPFDKDSEKDILNEVKEVEKKETKKSTKADTPKKESKTKTTKTKATDNKTSEPAFTAAEFKEWYQGTGSAADKKVAKALRAQLGRSGYKKLEDEAIDNYTPRGHLSMFKRVSAPTTETPSKMKESAKSKEDDWKSAPKNSGKYLAGKQKAGAEKEGLIYPRWPLVEAKVPKSSKDSKTSSKVEEPKKKPTTLVRVGVDPKREAKRVEEVKKQRVEEDKRDKAFLALPKPEKGSKGYATHMALRSYVRQGGFGDDSIRDALVRHGYPKETAYSKGIAEVIALGRKHGVIPESKITKKKPHSKTKKSPTTKRMSPSEVADMTTGRDWIYGD